MKKSYKRFFVIAIASVLMLSLVPAISFAASTTSTEKTDSNIKIESKEKSIKYKITWKANGGKIGSKKTVTTSVKRGSKINKLVSAPKRSGYSFKGGYTKKSGGIKISKNTKPKKTVTYYAQWKKKSSTTNAPRVLNAEEKKLIGTWIRGDNHGVYQFKKDGTYSMYSDNKAFYTKWHFIGYYYLKNGVLTEKYQCRKDYRDSGWGPWGAWETTKSNIEFGDSSDAIGGGQYFTFGGGGVKYYKQ